MNIGIGIGIDKQGPISSGPAYDSDYQAILTYAQAQGFTLPSDAEKAIANNLMVALKAAATNELSSYHLIRVYATAIDYSGGVPASLGYSGVLWNNPGTLQSSRTNTITHTQDKGYATDGSTSFISEAINLNTTIQNDFFDAQYIFNLQGDTVNGTTNSGFSTGQVIRWNGTEFGFSCNSAYANTGNSYSQNLGNNLFIATARDNSSDFDVWINGTIVDTITSASAAPPNLIDRSLVLYYDSAQAYQSSSTILAIKIKGKASEVNQAALYTAVNTYLTALADL